MMNRTLMCMLRGLMIGALLGAAAGTAVGRATSGKIACFKKKACKALRSMGSLVDAVGYLMK